MRARLVLVVGGSVPGDLLVDGVVAIVRDRGSRGRNLGALGRLLRTSRARPKPVSPQVPPKALPFVA